MIMNLITMLVIVSKLLVAFSSQQPLEATGAVSQKEDFHLRRNLRSKVEELPLSSQVDQATNNHDDLAEQPLLEVSSHSMHFSLKTYSQITIVIAQSNHPIDTNPIINLTEFQLFFDNVFQPVPESWFAFSAQSSGFPVVYCSDGVTNTGSGPYNMCKSANTNPYNQTLTIRAKTIGFNKIKIYNAHGFNNPGGYDVGHRIEGATLTLYDANTGAQIGDVYTFGAMAHLYVIDFPDFTPNPSSTPPSVTPTAAVPTRKPTAKPSTRAPTF